MPKLKPVFTPAEVSSGGWKGIDSFFNQKPKPGRKLKKSGKVNVGRPPLPKEPIPSALAPPTSAQVAAAASAKAAAATSTAEESSRLLTSAAVSAAAGMVLAQAEVAAVAAAAAASIAAPKGTRTAVAAAAAASTAAPKGTRTNWSTGEDLKRLTEAIFAWKYHMPPWESKLSLAGFAHKVRFPESTLGAYLNGKKYLDKGAGRPALLSRGDTQGSFHSTDDG